MHIIHSYYTKYDIVQRPVGPASGVCACTVNVSSGSRLLITQPSVAVHVLLMVNRVQNRKAYLLDKACFTCSNTVKTRKEKYNSKFFNSSPPPPNVDWLLLKKCFIW